MPRHRDLTGAGAAHQPGLISDVDPGAIGAGKLWIDTSAGTPPWSVWLRNDANDGWDATGSSLTPPVAALNGLTPAADTLAYYTSPTTAALTGFTAFLRTLLDDVDATAARATLGLGIGTAVQAYDAELAAIAGLASAADKLPYFTGSGAASLATFTTAGRALVDDADNTAQRATLGLGSLAVLSSLAHSALTGIGANDHHAQSHVLATTAALGADHTVSGLTSGMALVASSATAALFRALVQADIGGLTTASSPQFSGIKFPATDVPSADVNTLDDYEEGTFTPSITFGTPGNLSLGGVTAVGYYTKMGNRVLFHGQWTGVPTHTTASAQLILTGLPFTAQNTTNSNEPCALQWGGITKASYTSVVMLVGPGTSQATFPASGSGVASANVTAPDVPSGGTVLLRFSGHYFV